MPVLRWPDAGRSLICGEILCYNEGLNIAQTDGGMGMAKQKHEEKPLAQNKKASHDYFIEETYEAGIVLTGTEIKSVRQGRANINEDRKSVV